MEDKLKELGFTEDYHRIQPPEVWAELVKKYGPLVEMIPCILDSWQYDRDMMAQKGDDNGR